VVACVSGDLTCQGGVGPQPEVCDGVDNDCDGSTDELPLADAPAAGEIGCWTLPGSCCSFATPPAVTWCPPAGATCVGNGTLSPPCNHGFIACSGGTWSCEAAQEPSTEICNGIDDNCDGSVDEGELCPAGRSCTAGACR
jgi:hypothetical protein